MDAPASLLDRDIIRLLSPSAFREAQRTVGDMLARFPSNLDARQAEAMLLDESADRAEEERAADHETAIAGMSLVA